MILNTFSGIFDALVFYIHLDCLLLINRSSLRFYLIPCFFISRSIRFSWNSISSQLRDIHLQFPVVSICI
uniref:Uncharacterized protein n=1 Tax=Rhizophora mucronata TaxID=61149 RepID=A0A2P2PJ31_RHIMU